MLGEMLSLRMNFKYECQQVSPSQSGLYLPLRAMSIQISEFIGNVYVCRRFSSTTDPILHLQCVQTRKPLHYTD